MNKDRRNISLRENSNKLEVIRDDEDDAREGIKNPDHYEESENCSDIIEDAISDLDDVITSLEKII